MKLKPRKTPTTYVPKRAHRGHGVTHRQEVELRRMAGLIQNETQLIGIMAQTKSETREACLSRILPYLSFKLSPDFKLPSISNP